MNAFLVILIGIMLTQQMLCAQSADDHEFLLVKKSGDISLYERWIEIPGKDARQAREVKGVFYYKNSLHAGLRLLQDQKMAMKWQGHVSEFKLYPQRDSTHWYEYSYHDVPWPVSDQDHFMEYRISSSDHRQMLILFKSKVNDKLAPERKGVTRMVLTGSWLFEQMDEQVKVTYRVYSMPLNIPRVITDPIVRSNMVSTIEEFVALVERP